MNLIEDRWIPIRRKSGKQERIAPWELTDAYDTDPVVDLAAPRPDFKGALAQFLIGLLQTAAPPNENEGRNWADWLEEPPEPSILREAFAPYIPFFNLDGDGPRFMQDFDLQGGTGLQIASLLIDEPGENSIKKNTDHFVKRDRVVGLCSSCAAIALFTLQTNAPAGGAGHRTSLRGGGPLTTLVILDPHGSDLPDTIWCCVWLNVLSAEKTGNLLGNTHPYSPQLVFPWLSPTPTSEAGSQGTFPQQVHPLHMYWGMPRRIRLDCGHPQTGTCSICGNRSNQLIANYETRNYGINYSGAWQHPLSPYYSDKQGVLLPAHPQPGGITYQHWSSLVVQTENAVPSQVVTEFLTIRKQTSEHYRLWVFGYDMDNMKPRCWYEARFPLYLVDEGQRERFSYSIQAMVAAAELVAGDLRYCIMQAWFKRPGDAKGDTTYLKDAFYQNTELTFYNTLSALVSDCADEIESEWTLTPWYQALCRAAEELFDYWATREEGTATDPKRIARAHFELQRRLHGKKLKGLLNIPS